MLTENPIVTPHYPKYTTWYDRWRVRVRYDVPTHTH